MVRVTQYRGLVAAVLVMFLIAASANAAMRVERQRQRGPNPRDNVTSQTLPPRHQDRGTSQTLPPCKPTTGTQHLAFDARWLINNINQHTRMIAMCHRESELTTSTELKTFADDLATTLTAEVTWMRARLNDWYRIDYTPREPPEGWLPGTGFRCSQDQRFLAHVIAYEHITMASAAFPARWAVHPKLKIFAIDLIREAKSILRLVETWRVLLIRMDLENYFQNDGPEPPLAG